MIIGISGLSGVGKNEVSRLLVAQHGAIEVALADPLKRVAREIFGFTETQLWGPSEARNAPDERYPREHGPFENMGACPCCGGMWEQDLPQCYLTPRMVLQRIGTELGRVCYSDIWIEQCVKTAANLLGGVNVALHSSIPPAYTPQQGFHYAPGALWARAVVVPDVRFKNEILGLKKGGAKLVRVTRPGFEKPKWEHPSETEQMGVPDSEFDYLLKNDGTLQELGEKVGGMWKELSK